MEGKGGGGEGGGGGGQKAWNKEKCDLPLAGASTIGSAGVVCLSSLGGDACEG